MQPTSNRGRKPGRALRGTRRNEGRALGFTSETNINRQWTFKAKRYRTGRYRPSKANGINRRGMWQLVQKDAELKDFIEQLGKRASIKSIEHKGRRWDAEN
mgnify:CR=1 FL=1